LMSAGEFRYLQLSGCTVRTLRATGDANSLSGSRLLVKNLRQ